MSGLRGHEAARAVLPVPVGSAVTVAGAEGIWRVTQVTDAEARVVPWAGGDPRWAPMASLGCGFRRHMPVGLAPSPYLRTQRPPGLGEVLAVRTLGHREQVLVEFFESGRRVWVPFQHLRLVPGPKHRFVHEPFEQGQAERFRLRVLAHALSHWNANTGALSRLDIDPLPHQLQLVHDILASGTLNWLIADDVGLGKTIEVGMLLHALMQRAGRRRPFERILIVTPAGLTRQWQEELSDKFGMDDFVVYGRDVEVHQHGHWALHPRVIASMDRLKAGRHLESIQASGMWDLIVFDEAHRLTRRVSGRRYDASDRYALAAALRRQTDNLLFLTATPHQGREDLFIALLELLRPEWSELFRRLSQAPEVIREMVYRNRKSDATDADGRFLFHGQRTMAVQVPASDLELEFDRALQDYVRRGYRTAKRQGQTGRAIGFVMTVFRKLAASSSAAILRSLERRLTGLQRRPEAAWEEDPERDERYQGEHEEETAARPDLLRPFFEGEASRLAGLVQVARRMAPEDTKLRFLLDQLVPGIEAEDPDEPVVLFTEYRGTQEQVAGALRARYGEDAVTLIHGGMSLDDRRASVARFQDGTARFMVSTEAGGEGINLHQRCHILVNYDLPWNPSRLVQRVGRLYRYGQTRQVRVFNLYSPETLDGRVVAMMYDRIERIVRDMAPLGDEFHERLHTEVFGEVVALADLESVLEKSTSTGVARTQERVDEALERARRAHALEAEVLAEAQRFDPAGALGDLRLDQRHVHSFVQAMLRLQGCELLGATHGGQVLDVRLTPDLARQLGRRRRRCRVTASRRLARGQVEMMDFQSPLFQWLVEAATDHDFGGLHAAVHGLEGQALVAARLRWQSGHGRPLREELLTLLVDAGGAARANAPEVVEWLARPAHDGTTTGSRAERVGVIESARTACDERLADASNLYLHPLQSQILAAAWSSDAPSEP